MTELLTAAQMRAIEQAAIESGEVTGLELMERAGRGVVEAILEWRPELANTSHRAVVLCGPGNNGGDGFVIARLLKQRGWDIEVYLYGDEAKLPPDAEESARRWRELGEVERIEKFRRLWREHLVIDALFGTGLTRPIEDELAGYVLWELVDAVCFENVSGAVPDLEAKQFAPLVVSVDVPTGCCADSGKGLGDSVHGVEATHAHLTVTFHSPKIGHYVDSGGWGNGPCLAGELKVVDIGLKSSSQTTNVALSSPSDSFKLVTSHKYSHGHALILSGGSGKGGAARLAARGALRIGAGLVTVGCPEEALVENASRLDAVMLAPIKCVDGLQTELRDRKVKAVCIGPGFGLGARLRDFVASILSESSERSRIRSGTAKDKRLAVVLDADALTEFRDDPETLFAMLHEGCVLTPHEGEFGRLFPDILAKLKEPATKGPAYSKVDATREAAKRAGCVVLFKGADTVIAHPDGRCSINSAHYERSAPWLATAGSGDVLAGFITGLLARGFDPMQAAETAAWLHVECALKFGPGLIAEDLPEQLPAVFRDLGL